MEKAAIWKLFAGVRRNDDLTKERPILLEIIEDRHDRKSIVMASQLPVENWYDAIGDQAVADAVLDRIVHSSHRIELFGESIRKMKAKK